MININLKNIPSKPGIYIFKNNKNQILYIGKTKNLKKRIQQYFNSSSPKIKNLLKISSNFEYLETENEFLAFLKESNLIKKFKPPYNQLLRDDTLYFYLIFTKDKFPKVLITHQPKKFQTDKVIGPFIEGSFLKEILKIIRKEIPFCTCLKEHQRICLNTSLGLCLGFCCQKNLTYTNQDLKNYKTNLEIIEKIFTKDLLKLKKILLKRIKEFLNKNNLEKALKLKKIYLTIKKIESQQNLIKEKDLFLLEHQTRRILEKIKTIFNLDTLPHHIEVIDISHLSGKEKVGIVATFIDGIYQPRFLKKFIIKNILKPDDPRMIYEVLKRRLSHKEWGYPDLILIDGGKIQFKFSLKAIQENNLNIKILAFAKPKKEIYYNLNKKPLNLNKHKELKEFILFLDKKTHSLAINYHRRKREKIAIK